MCDMIVLDMCYCFYKEVQQSNNRPTGIFGCFSCPPASFTGAWQVFSYSRELNKSASRILTFAGSR